MKITFTLSYYLHLNYDIFTNGFLTNAYIYNICYFSDPKSVKGISRNWHYKSFIEMVARPLFKEFFTHPNLLRWGFLSHKLPKAKVGDIC